MNAQRIILTFLCAALAPCVARGALSDGLVAAWSLNESSNESAAVARADLLGVYTLTDNNTTPSAAGHVYPNAAHFTTANSEFLSNNSLGFGGTVTIAAWFKADALAGNPVILGKDINTPANSRDFTLDWVTNTLRFYINGGNSGFATQSFTDTTDWHLVVCWFNDDNETGNTLNIQLDNGTVQTTTGVTATRDNSASSEFRIGARQYASFEGYFDGKIGPVFTWNRVLTSGERTELHNGGNGFPLPWATGFHSKRLSSPILKARIIQ